MNDRIDAVVSIIVPVYKVEQYLSFCMDSLLQQTYPYLEIILIDDGSPDRCPEICEDYAKKDQRVQVIHQKNDGLSAARNTGIRAATGKYILFVDSDDMISQDACEVLVKKAEEYSADIVVGNYCWFDETGNRSYARANVYGYKMPEIVVDGQQFLLAQLQHVQYESMVWSKLYRRDCLLCNALYFLEGILQEDEEWTPRVFCVAERVVQEEKVFYQYRIRRQSIMTNSALAVKRQKDFIDIIAPSVEQTLQAVTPILREHMMQRLFYEFVVDLSQFPEYFLQHKNELNQGFWARCLSAPKMHFWIVLLRVNLRLFIYVWRIRAWLKYMGI